jgi:hypothetical protein
MNVLKSINVMQLFLSVYFTCGTVLQTSTEAGIDEFKLKFIKVFYSGPYRSRVDLQCAGTPKQTSLLLSKNDLLINYV